MKRRWFNFAGAVAVVSLVLCVAAGAMWVCSYRFAVFAGKYDGRGGAVGVVSWDGTLYCCVATNGMRRGHGFYCNTSPQASPPAAWVARVRYVALPYWGICLISGIAGCLGVRARVMQGRRLEVGRCSNCGYDLRATPERCPECGAVAAGS